MVSRRDAVLGIAASAALAGCTTAAAPGTPAPSTGVATIGPGGSTGPGPSVPPAGSGPAPSTGPVRPVPGILSSPGPDVVAGPRGIPAVALTFHGAGTAQTATDVLDLAARRSARITVFAVGEWLRANPALGHRIVDDGHDLGNHTWSHQQMRQLTPERDADEVLRGAEAVAAILGTPGALFRPSGIESSTPTIRAAAARAGYSRCVSYDVDSLDYTDPGPTTIVGSIRAALAPGSIVSLHLGHPGTVAALPAILDLLAARGLAPVTVSGLLGSDSPPVLATT